MKIYSIKVSCPAIRAKAPEGAGSESEISGRRRGPDRLYKERARMRSMREIVKDRNIYHWAAELISALAQVRLS